MLPKFQLLEAVRFGLLQETVQAIEAGADVNARQSDGTTPLMQAARDGHFYVADKLLQANVDSTRH